MGIRQLPMKRDPAWKTSTLSLGHIEQTCRQLSNSSSRLTMNKCLDVAEAEASACAQANTNEPNAEV